MAEEEPQRKRRVRYRGTHPRHFKEKYKELDPEKYAGDLEKIIESGKTPAGMHRSILVKEVLDVLCLKPGMIGLDATLGYGGHAREMLEQIRPHGKLFALDVDPLEIERTESRLRKLGYTENELVVRRLNFAGVPKLLRDVEGGFDFILADLGVSSMQLDNPERGFTFKAKGPLDLRLNPERGQTAAAFIQSASVEVLEKILRENSDEHHAAVIAKAIFENKNLSTTTTNLANVIRRDLTKRYSDIDEKDIVRSLQRTFQALRIQVNEEFSALEQFLRNLPLVLKAKGRVAILSFHSGEDNRVAESFKQGLESGVYESVSETPIQPGREECYDNPRAKSALLRWAVRSF
jgi:16S rRNA (cytosine1402-N4)-methyltransferase